MKISLVDLVLLFLYFYVVSCNSSRSQALLPGHFLSFSAGDTLVSELGKFELGFFSPDTWLPGARIGFDKSKNTLQKLTSWRNLNDPATGKYSLQLDQNQNGELVLLDNRGKNWRSGPWDEGGFDSLAERKGVFNFSYDPTKDSKYITFNVFGESDISRIVLDSRGLMGGWFWSKDHQKWQLVLFGPADFCDRINICGSFGICYITSAPPCECLQGYEPKYKLDWDINDYSGGCVRKTPMQCGSKNVGFVRIQNVKLPTSSESMLVGNDQICEYICLSNCSCNAYAYSSGGQCLLWNGDLFDLKRLPNNSSQVEFNLKLFESSNKGKKKPLLVALAASITSAIFVCGTCCYFLWRRNLREKGILRKKKFREMLLSESATNLAKPGHSSNKGQEKKSDIELKFFELHDLKVATDNFLLDNKLGEGGFGAVFKGQLPDGQQIAVKRLSTQSRQGIREFKTEALLIAKLQHRNLVRFFGCCVEDEEKMLIYEYMPNKSLDYFIFDESRKSLLDWKKRHEIIIGIARGILYLHQDSRLKIIHRDLKASNILLDEDMNPKISDFGTARIFSGNQNEAKTLRVVGTYAYMSPEYALAGLFSVKSDVFSFGVMVLEVISGKKNRISYNSDSPPNLIRQAWELWNDGRDFELIDPTIVDSCTNEEALRCIQIGLLCLQIDAADRPTMSSILFMLSNEGTVPSPKHPLITLTSDSITMETTSSSINEVTITAPDVR
ncbi:G-type lectin S-receptor-like serine/threonine-protein kinase At1g11330 isoform X2 [Nicotiana tabacum]|uniref:non-specific serine/threonine protein kinase n=1 Tax=Nicotiana tabacum TaxID=4097 RepID=A0A1S4C899_TOBAC|nr:PREDICTED: putative G-type lectin S-receptor-like serine/threonine-protein kinase At1g61610 isoform X2 [Nicotiana tabacum]